MRVSEQERTERKGLRKVCDDFEAIGWGPVRNSDHDLGTDLLVLARDERRFDRGLVVGVQVKAGASYFRERNQVKGGPVPGWWYYESDTAHFDDWASHGLPHLLVMCNLEEGKSYWVHVTADEVVSTGKGCKIVVPEHQTIDDDHVGDLFAAACEHKAAPLIEGTAFSGLPGGIPPARRLRYALAAPRLVAPHPNAGQEDAIDAAEGAALLAQGRFGDLVRFAEKHDSVPDPQQPYSGQDWGWLFVSAIWIWAFTDAVDNLEAVFSEARSPEEAAASGVVLACALHRAERCDRALEVLDGLVDSDDLSPVDHGWVLVQRARFRTETGEFAGARLDAANAQRCFPGDRNDITASALAAAAAWQLYAAAWLADPSDWAAMNEEFDKLVAAGDTAVSWWRAQTLSWGLGRVEEKRFEAWADPHPRHLFRWEGFTTQELFAADFSADVTGEHGSWKHACSMYGRQRLVDAARSDDEESELVELVEGLSALRRSGDDKSLEKAIRRLRHDGPIGPVVEVVNRISPSGWTHTTADPNFAALAGAGDLVGEPEATELACWCADMVEHPAEFNETLKPSKIVPMAAIEAVTGLLHAAGERAHNAAARVVAGLPDPAPQMTVQQVCAAIRYLDYDKVDAQGRQALWEMARELPGWRAVTALGWLADNGHQEAGAEAVSRAVAGDLLALGAIADLSSLDPGEAQAVIGHLADAAEQNLADARNGSYGGDRIDAAYWLAEMSPKFPDCARWDKAVELLTDPSVAGHDKRYACLLVARKADRLSDEELPASVRGALAADTASIAAARPGIGLDADIGGIDTVVAIGLGALDGGNAAAALAKLAVGTPEQRRDAAILLGWGLMADQQPMLAVLAGDPHHEVRNEAAHAIGRLAASDPTPQTHALAWEMARSKGILLPASLLSGLAADETPARDITVDIAQHLQQHPSAIIRNWTHRILR